MVIPLGSCPRTQHLSRLAVIHEPSVCPAWHTPNPKSCTERIPSPACGGRGSHEKNARIFFMGAREGGRRPEGGEYKTRIYPAWHPTLPTNPGFVPLGGLLRAQRLSRLAGPVITPFDGVWCRLIVGMETLQVTFLQQTGIYPVDDARIYASWRLRCQARPVLRWVGVSAAWLRVAASA